MYGHWKMCFWKVYTMCLFVRSSWHEEHRKKKKITFETSLLFLSFYLINVESFIYYAFLYCWDFMTSSVVNRACRLDFSRCVCVLNLYGTIIMYNLFHHDFCKETGYCCFYVVSMRKSQSVSENKRYNKGQVCVLEAESWSSAADTFMRQDNHNCNSHVQVFLLNTYETRAEGRVGWLQNI